LARQYAQIITAIWRDDDFTALPHDEQWMYLLLNTQPDISAAGVLTLAITRWAKRSPTMKPEMINELLDRLAVKRFVAIDRDTDEVLVRTFIRWDKGYSNPKRQPAIRDAINAVESESILAVLAVEVDRIALPTQWRGHADGLSDSLSAEPEWANVPTFTGSTTEKTFPQEDSLSDAYRMPIDRHAASERRVPQPTTRNPQPATQNQSQDQNLLPHAPRSAGTTPEPEALPGTELAVLGDAVRAKTSPRGTRLAEDWVPSEQTRLWARTEFPGVDLRTEHTKFVNYWLAKTGRDATKRDWDRTWQNWIITAAERAGIRRGAPAPTTDDGRSVHRKTAVHLDHLAAYGGTDA
jgi:hypothetical protein